KVKNLKPKTLVIWGKDDKLLSVSNAYFLKENVPDVNVYVLEGAGHTPMKTHASILSELIQKYL
ncbi:MAG: hypothetical protein KDD25_06055, partial [Bdellovibrionales bacterium]|nr:hypothetical protein [Bdellovibrionales bacterium]